MARLPQHQFATLSMSVAGGEFTASWPRRMRSEDLRRARTFCDVILGAWIDEAVRRQSHNRSEAEAEYVSWFHNTGAQHGN